MIKNVFKLNGKYIDVANSWDDLTWRQYWRILNMGDSIPELVSIFTNVPRETLENAEISGLEQVIAASASLKEPPQWDGLCDRLGKYELPVNNSNGNFDIQFESLGQLEDMRVIMNTITDIKGLTDAQPRFCAIYLQKIRDGVYNPEKAKEMVEEVRDYSCKEVMSVGSFFYAKLRSLLSGTPPSSPSTPQSPKKSKPASRTSTKSSARTRR